MGRAARVSDHRRREQPMECPMPQRDDLSRSLVPFEQDGTLVAVVELSRSSWLVAGLVPGIGRHPLKKLDPSEEALLALLRRWRDEAAGAGRPITRLAVAFEAGRDGFWLARWLRARGVEAHVIHPTSVAVSREHRRAKTDRLDAGLLKRAFLGWLRGEPGHCTMAAVPTLEEEDAKRPSREREGLVGERTRIVNRMKGALARLGVRGFKPGLRKAPERLEALRTPEGAPLPLNTLAELRRDMARLRLVREQIAELEAARLQRLEEEPADRGRYPAWLHAPWPWTVIASPGGGCGQGSGASQRRRQSRPCASRWRSHWMPSRTRLIRRGRAPARGAGGARRRAGGRPRSCASSTPVPCAHTHRRPPASPSQCRAPRAGSVRRERCHCQPRPSSARKPSSRA